MFIGLTAERSNKEYNKQFQWKPGHYESTIVSRYWWLWFAVSFFKVDEYNLATKEYDWRE